MFLRFKVGGCLTSSGFALSEAVQQEVERKTFTLKAKVSVSSLVPVASRFSCFDGHNSTFPVLYS